MPFGGITDDYTCWKPIIAAVNGYAVGGGLELVLACDLAIASDNAQFGAPEGKVGLVAAAGGVHRLPRQVPLKIAMGMLLAGRVLNAEEANRYGLVNEVVPGDFFIIKEIVEKLIFSFSSNSCKILRGVSCLNLLAIGISDSVISSE